MASCISRYDCCPTEILWDFGNQVVVPEICTDFQLVSHFVWFNVQLHRTIWKLLLYQFEKMLHEDSLI